MISIVIITYNRNKDLFNLLDSIYKQILNKKKYEVIIVDNSFDKNAKKICDKYSKTINLKYIWNWKNLGAAGGRNIWIKNSKHDYILFLDDDNYLQDNDILQKIYEEDIVVFHTDKYIWAIKYGNYFEDKNTKKYVYISRLVTCWLLITKSIFKKIWTFNESMNVYEEDIELWLRMIKKWYFIILNNFIFIEHRKSKENPSIRKKEFRLYQTFRNRILTIWLNFPLILFPVYTINFFTINALIYSKNYNVNFVKVFKLLYKAYLDWIKMWLKQKRYPMNIKTRFFLRFWAKKLLKMSKEFPLNIKI